jgi:hypothetical protein
MAEKLQSLEDIQAEYKERIKLALEGAKTKFKTELELAALTFESLTNAGEKAIWKHPTIAPILKTLGLQPIPAAPEPASKAKTSKKTRKRGPNKPKVEPSSVNVLTFIGSGKKRLGELTEYFGQAVKPVLKQLETQRKVAKDIDKKTGGKPATVYSNVMLHSSMPSS